MLIFFYAGLFTRLKYLNMMICLENTDSATILTKVRNELKRPISI